ncbi:hypothetical protein GO986_15745 [Deinococcus sp. HMF7620]|uniref:Reverse transcriptase domain-containing protein n=1 Tax=Deinococcus arboris TaxID=2682977 RepID=A0A7C9MA84_9DEIO|nr:reverse transcriptase domain-containing protein [Deinococcus arboris]MVN88203.1 hypothetical protein [Deinococcus arboris]
MGVDGIEFRDFEKQLEKNLDNISLRLLSGRYFFSPLREIEIPKIPKGYRTLSISTIRDAIAQRQIYSSVYELFDKQLMNQSGDEICFAYRKGFSAPRAAMQVRKYLNSGYVWAVDADISKFFDEVDHEILIDKLSDIIEHDELIINLFKRFIKSDKTPSSTYLRKIYKGMRSKFIFKITKPKRVHRSIGIPQGGMLSGLLANIYLADFDKWIIGTLRLAHDLVYIRYADDFIILAKSKDSAEAIKAECAEALHRLRLTLNEKKTFILDCNSQDIEFLGYKISSRQLSPKSDNIIKYIKSLSKTLDEVNYDYLIGKTKSRCIRRLANRVNHKILGLPEKRCELCNGTTNGNPKSWVSFFSATTNPRVFRVIDKEIRRIIYLKLNNKLGITCSRRELYTAGLLSLEREYYRIKHLKKCECRLNIFKPLDYNTLSPKNIYKDCHINSKINQSVMIINHYLIQKSATYNKVLIFQSFNLKLA